MKQIYSNKFKLIICIGYPKTGTTYLQNFFFDKIENINYIGIRKKFDSDLFHIRNSVIKNSDKDFKKNLPSLKSIFRKKIIKNSINLYSDEHFLNPSFSGYERTIKRLNQIFIEFKKNLTVIVFKRKQSDLILSNYKESEHVKKVLKINSFNEILVKLKKNMLNRNDEFFLEQYDFHKLKKYLVKNLSRKIIFYNYEDFAKNNKRFLNNFLRKNKFIMNDKIELIKINKNLIQKDTIKTKHNMKKIVLKNWIIFIKKILINILPLKIRYFLEDKIIMIIFFKKEKVKLELLSLIDNYYKKKGSKNRPF